MDEGVLGRVDGEAQRVVDDARGNLAVQRESWKDRQSRGVSGGPAVRPQRIAIEVEHRTGRTRPAAPDLLRGEHLVEMAVASVNDKDVAVAARLHGSVERHRVRAGIALAA